MSRKKSYESGGVAGTQALRREQVAAQQITAHVSTLGDHARCDPSKPDSLCEECAELLVASSVERSHANLKESVENLRRPICALTK